MADTLANILAGLDGDPRRSLRNPLDEAYREQYNPWGLPPTAPNSLAGGEIRNPPPRPADAMAPVAEMLSPTMGGYGAANTLAGLLTDAYGGDWKGAADKLPMALGIFGFGRRAPAVAPKAPTLATLGRNDPSRPPVYVPAEATAKSTTGVSVSQNLRHGERPSQDGELPFEYIIYKDGVPLGSVGGWQAGNTMHIGGFDVKGGPNALGVVGIRQMHGAIKQDFPDVNTFAGSRAMGAGGKEQMWRREQAGWRAGNRDQVVDFSKR